MSAENNSVVCSSVNSIVTVIVAPYGVESSHLAGLQAGFVSVPVNVRTLRSRSHLRYCGGMVLESDLLVDFAPFRVTSAHNRITST